VSLKDLPSQASITSHRNLLSGNLGAPSGELLFNHKKLVLIVVMRPLFSYFFTASFEDQVRQQVSISNRFCPHQQHVRALSGVAGSQLQCQCADTFRDAGAFAFSLDGEMLTQATRDVPRVSASKFACLCYHQRAKIDGVLDEPW
jgi:hypothetical protein